jgi:hypothetical protein
MLYGCETWSLTFKQKTQTEVVWNSMLRRIFECTSTEVTGGWRLLYEGLHNWNSLLNIIRMIK